MTDRLLTARELAGALALDAAHADATAARRRKDRLAELEPQLLALVDAGVVDLDEEELRRLALSIATSGQHVPCVMGPDGLGYDGRNRVAACAIADVAPTWTIYDRDPVAYIVDVNAERRHFSTGQRAMAVAIGLVEQGKRANGRFAYGSKPSGSRGTSRSAWSKALELAGVVLDHTPELADLVLAGALAAIEARLDALEQRLAEPEPAPAPATTGAPLNGQLTVDEAIAAATTPTGRAVRLLSSRSPHNRRRPA